MAELIDVKRTKAEKKATEERWKADSAEEMDDYPYGLSIHIDDETMAKLGLADSDFDTGEPVMVMAEGVITNDQINSVNGKTRRSMSIQLRKIAVSQTDQAEDMATTLYGDKD